MKDVVLNTMPLTIATSTTLLRRAAGSTTLVAIKNINEIFSFP